MERGRGVVRRQSRLIDACMPTLEINPTVRIESGPYAAEISPAAGARLLSLTYTDAHKAIDCVVPWKGGDTFDAHDWPKAGAFVMLPFTNRLAPARFNWQGQTITLDNGSPAGQGLHGFGHRRSWQLRQATLSSASLHLVHPAQDAEWPWAFEAKLMYQLSDAGLRIELTLLNTSAGDMPLSLGWHPFLPHSAALFEDQIECVVQAMARHPIGLDGLGLVEPSVEKASTRTFQIQTQQAGTTAFENYGGVVRIPLTANWRLRMSSQHASHLLVHVPLGLRHMCVEPISALPGALKQAPGNDSLLSLGSGHARSLICNLGLELAS
jgi:aldose 1-epimerase